MNIGALPTDLTSSSDRKFLGSGKLPPSPTRTIAPGDKLPPAQHAHSPSSEEESGPEDTGDDPRTLLPDASRASRLPPTLRAPRINIPAYSAQVIVAGARVLVAAHHHLRCFELSCGRDNSPIWVGDTKEMGVRDEKVTVLKFRAGSTVGVVWAGTKEGHLLEGDMDSGEVIRSEARSSIHPFIHFSRFLFVLYPPR